MGSAANNEIDFFKLLGIKRSFNLSLEELDARYFTLQMEKHPDRNKNGDEISADLNVAYRVLKNPVSRAEYLLTLSGYSASDMPDISDLFEIQEKFSRLTDEKEIKDKITELQKDIFSLSKSLLAHDLKNISQDDIDKMFSCISRIKFIKKIINRLEKCSV